MFVLEALRAKHGDCLLLHFGTAAKPRLAVIDGGPPGVFNDALKPRLAELRAERGLAADEPLEIDLMMVSHIDDDHIAGLLQMMRKLRDLRESGEPEPWRIRRFWHNAFDDLVGNDEVAVGTPTSAVSVASLGGLLRLPGEEFLASVPQGRDFRNLLRALGLDGNPPFGGLVRAGNQTVEIDNLKLTVVAPLDENLTALQKDWDKKIKPILKKEQPTPADLAEAAAYLDKSAYNLASLVILAEADGKRILLTGDARGDHTLTGLEAAGLLDDDGVIEVDVLKLPHHGSDRNVDTDYFESIVAEHYVISADGKHENPDVATLEMLSDARDDDDFTIHLTYPLDGFKVAAVGQDLEEHFERERAAGRTYGVGTRAGDALGVRIEID